jgi:acyl carrier protein
MNDQHQEDLVRSALCLYLDRDTKSVHGSDDLESDLGMTTLDVVLVALHLEDLMAVELPIEKIEDVHTVTDFVRFIDTCMREQQRESARRVPRAPISEIRPIEEEGTVPLGFARAFARSFA